MSGLLSNCKFFQSWEDATGLSLTGEKEQGFTGKGREPGALTDLLDLTGIYGRIIIGLSGQKKKFPLWIWRCSRDFLAW